ncbi:hypothetical protein C1Y35_07770 [Pseudomonas sp. GW456-L14]|uniref:TniQ family protein n=1 Tax=unclassified Pseudomonas TaxID=196821 RepID=UPI000C8851BB|nr:hypothetical protein C1Y35_07770 [Pseudomonas sp. GW456-L14]PMY50785.1 hypothetical protein C1Y34_25495 [Pseudomonas sp. GW456-L12]
MEASYTWHPAAHGLNPRWPLTPQLLPDELFSSWLVRTALAHACTPETLTDNAWPKSRIWCIDLDRGLSESRLAVLAQLTGVSVADLTASTLLLVAHALHPDAFLQISNLWPWILVLGCRNHFHAGGLQCCPGCMDEPAPHYLIQDRLAWHTSCPLHRSLLVDRCPRCFSALQPGLLRVGNSLAQCHHCGEHFSIAAPLSCSEEALAFQRFADGLYGKSTAFGQAEVGFAEWMFVARVIISLLRSVVRHPTASSRLFCQLMEVDVGACPTSSLGLPFEYLQPAERSALIGPAWVIMQAGPERFIECATRASLPHSLLPIPVRDAPEILTHMASALSCRPRCSPDMTEHNHTRNPLGVWRMWLRLQRRIRRDGFH